jgi:hypothetical protein
VYGLFMGKDLVIKFRGFGRGCRWKVTGRFFRVLKLKLQSMLNDVCFLFEKGKSGIDLL